MPPSLIDNPYPSLLRSSLGERGVETITGRARVTWALRAASTTDVVHLHWLELYVNVRGRWVEHRPRWSALAYLLRACRLLASLAVLRASGVRIVWTVHNLRPHEQRFPTLDRMLVRAVGWLSEAIVVHSHFACRRLRHEYPWLKRPVWVAPHGSYVGSYPQERRGRREMRRELAIPDDAFVFLIFGQLRPYKRVDEAIGAFRRLEGASVHLIVAGAPLDDEVRDGILRAVGGDPRVHVRLGFVADGDVADLHAAADAAVVAYPEVFSSGALLLALSQGLAIVAPRESPAPEVGGPPAVVMFEPGRLTEAMAGMRDGPDDGRRKAAVDAASRQSWQAAAARVHAAYVGEDPDVAGDGAPPSEPAR